MVESSPESLRQQVLLNHFVNATGCLPEQALQYLQMACWQFETALSYFFQEGTVQPVGIPAQKQMCPPCNTPATPPCFPDALMGMSKLTASDWATPAPPPPTQPSEWATPAPPPPIQPTKVLATCNYLPPTQHSDKLHCDTWLCEDNGFDKSGDGMDMEQDDPLPQLGENQPRPV